MTMNIFEFLDHMLEKLHDYPHKAHHYNKTILASIKKSKSKYRNSLKKYLKSNTKNKVQKYTKKLADLLDKKIQITKIMIEQTENVLNEFKTIVIEKELPISLELPPLSNNPNVIKTGKGGGMYCECKKGSYGDMIQCDSVKCKIKWFHFKCVGITTSPKGNWYCTECKKDWRLTRLD